MTVPLQPGIGSSRTAYVVPHPVFSRVGQTPARNAHTVAASLSATLTLGVASEDARRGDPNVVASADRASVGVAGESAVQTSVATAGALAACLRHAPSVTPNVTVVKRYDA